MHAVWVRTIMENDVGMRNPLSKVSLNHITEYGKLERGPERTNLESIHSEI